MHAVVSCQHSGLAGGGVATTVHWQGGWVAYQQCIGREGGWPINSVIGRKGGWPINSGLV